MSKNVDVENHLEEDGTSTFMVFPSDPGMSKKSFQIEVGYRDNYFHSRPRIWTCFSFIHFHILLSSQESQGEPAISWLEILYGFQQSLIILLAPHQDGTKQGQRRNRTSWPLVYLCVAFPWVQAAGLASTIFARAFWSRGWTTVSAISLFRGERAPHSGRYEFHRCALPHEVARRYFFAKFLSVPLALGIVFFQALTKIHDHGWLSEQVPIQKADSSAV